MVVKRNGSLEEFDVAKIARVTQAAGLEEEQAKVLAKKVGDFFSKLPQTQISSLQIRDKVAEELKEVNSRAADLFSWYEKTKEE